MLIFLDTANTDEIRRGVDLGVVDGVTTNPTLISKEKRKFSECIKEIVSICKGPVSVEVISTDADGMLKEAREYASWAENIVVKIPMTMDGVKATKQLSSEGVKVNMTLVFSVNQAILAAKAGAHFVSPFIGRIDDVGYDGMSVLSEIVDAYSNYEFETLVLAASLRHPRHVRECALIGADIATMPFPVFEQIFKHPLTDAGLKRFLEDWEKAKDIL